MEVEILKSELNQFCKLMSLAESELCVLLALVIPRML